MSTSSPRCLECGSRDPECRLLRGATVRLERTPNYPGRLADLAIRKEHLDHLVTPDFCFICSRPTDHVAEH